MLTRGPNSTSIDSLKLKKIQVGYMANIHKMAEAGKLQVAGLFGDNGNRRSIFILDVKSEEEIKELLKTDPAVQTGRPAYEIHSWWTEKGTCLK